MTLSGPTIIGGSFAAILRRSFRIGFEAGFTAGADQSSPFLQTFV